MLSEKELIIIARDECVDMLGKEIVFPNKDKCCAAYGMYSDGLFHFNLGVDIDECEFHLGDETPMDYYAFVVVDPETGKITRDYESSTLPIRTGKNNEVIMTYSLMALKIAEQAHKGQKDKAEEEYILHPMYVAEQMETEAEKAVAYLHDVVEDTDITLSQLREIGFSEQIVEAVDAITKRKGEEYDEYIKRVAENPIAKKVKLADMKHNSDISRYKNPTEENRKKCAKYIEKIKILKDFA